MPTQQNLEKQLLAAARPNLYIFRVLEKFFKNYRFKVIDPFQMFVF